MNLLSTKLVGFLEFIPRTHIRQLQRLRYKSLYSFQYEDPEDAHLGNRIVLRQYYFILFGPLALCNSSDEVSVKFFNFDDRDGSLLIWRMVYNLSVEEHENDWDTLTSFKSEDSFTIADANLTPDGESYAPFGIGGMSDLKRIFTSDGLLGTRKKVEYFVKVILHHRSNYVFKNFEYEADEEVLVKYSLADRLIL